MPMNHTGLAKLIEECGEVIQVAGKILAMPEGLTEHWDGGPPLDTRLGTELGDLYAAIAFVIWRRNLSPSVIGARAQAKLAMFKNWDADEKS